MPQANESTPRTPCPLPLLAVTAGLVPMAVLMTAVGCYSVLTGRVFGSLQLMVGFACAAAAYTVWARHWAMWLLLPGLILMYAVSAYNWAGQVIELGVPWLRISPAVIVIFLIVVLLVAVAATAWVLVVWQDKPAPRTKKRMMKYVIGGVVGSLLIQAMVVAAVQAQRQAQIDRRNTEICQANMSILAKAILAYPQTHSGKMPATLGDVHPEPVGGKAVVPACPLTHKNYVYLGVYLRDLAVKKLNSGQKLGTTVPDGVTVRPEQVTIKFRRDELLPGTHRAPVLWEAVGEHGKFKVANVCFENGDADPLPPLEMGKMYSQLEQTDLVGMVEYKP
jgi:hypothetical protein